jgi:hypothetical protein
MHRSEIPDDRVVDRLRADHWNRLDAHDQLLELQRFVPAEALGTVFRCETCGKPLAAQALCHACGDEEEMAA